jgi:hypothetical protein
VSKASGAVAEADRGVPEASEAVAEAGRGVPEASKAVAEATRAVPVASRVFLVANGPTLLLVLVKICRRRMLLVELSE